MVFELLDPRIQQVLRDMDIHEPTGPQREAIPIILGGSNLLLVAHTGIGKTEAAMLPIFHRLLGTPGKGIRCIYITPLRALNRDMLKRLTEFGEALDLDVAVRHGDTSQTERQHQSKSPPDVLITTPETLQVLFTGKRLREHLSRVRYVVVDEIHELANNERGAQLAVALERLVEVSGEFQRIGLSATVGSVEEVACYLGGVGREVRTVRAQISKELQVTIHSPEVTDADRDLAGRLQSDPHLVSGMRRCKALIEKHRSTLLFVNTRDTAEALAARYHIWDEDLKVGVHHGSLSKEIRIEMEEAFKEERLKGLICTSSLELGIDIGSVDFAIQYNSPRQVSRLIQRMGRAGHSVGERSEGAIVASNPDEIAESMVIARKAVAGELEEHRVRERPMAVLANQLVAAAMSGQVEKELIYQVFSRAYPFRNLGRDKFHGVLEQLVGIGLLFDNESMYRRTNRGMRYFYDNLSMIPDERTFLIRDIATRRVVGTLDESFVVSFAEPYAAFITHGRTWRIVEVREDELLVEQVREIGSIPSWVGEDIPVPFDVAQEVGRLRRVRDYRRYSGDEDAVRELDRYLKEQDGDGGVPSDEVVTLEMGRRMAVLNMCFGTKVNETVSKVLSVLLSARLGESVGVHTDPYRIVIELPRDIAPKLIIDTLRSIKSEGVESLVRLVLKSSSYLRYRFVYVAKKFGAIEKDADYRQVNFTRLAEAFEDTPLFEEAIRRVLWEDFDIDGTVAAMRRIESGEITFQVMGLTAIGRAGLQHSRELIMPQRADHSILMALKKRLEAETMSMSCLSCQTQWRLKAQDAPERIVCPRCGGQMVAALLPYNREDIGLLKRPRPTEEESKEIRRMYKNASLVREHGRRAMVALAGRGIGPDTADRVLSSFYDSEDEFLRDILSAELNYARTKRFWD
jgi:ATP-dependent Lhr-like helicase